MKTRTHPSGTAAQQKGFRGQFCLLAAVGGAFLWISLTDQSAAQSIPPPPIIQDVTQAPGGQIWLRTDPRSHDPLLLKLQSADSPEGPWANESEFTRSLVPGGVDFLTPRKSYYPRRFYRVELTGRQGGNPQLPWIQWIAPKKNTNAFPPILIRRGQSITLCGARFSPVLLENAVTFHKFGGNETWNATVTTAAANYLMVTVPPQLPAPPPEGTTFNVSVTTTAGSSNWVACTVDEGTEDGFSLRPESTMVILPPGSGKGHLVAGGGTPPYHLLAMSPQDAAKASAVLSGPIVNITGLATGQVTIAVEDSSNPPRSAYATVDLRPCQFDPYIQAAVHTDLPGSAPGMTITMLTGTNQLETEQVELAFQNAQIEIAHLVKDSIVGIADVYYNDGVHLNLAVFNVTNVTAERAQFDILGRKDRIEAKSGWGEIIKSPPLIRLFTDKLQPGALNLATLNHVIMLADSIVRLPSQPFREVKMDAKFTSVSTLTERHEPKRVTQSTSIFTGSVTSGGPRLERVVPFNAEVGRHITLHATGLAPTPAQNTVTFNGEGGARVPAEIVSQNAQKIVVIVPWDARSGPVQIESAGKTSNPFQFYARFHAETAFQLESTAPDSPTGLHLFHQQTILAGEERFHILTTALGRGRLSLGGLSPGQTAGSLTIDASYSSTPTVSPIIYRGPDIADASLHVFDVRRYDDTPIATIAFQDAGGGDGVNATLTLDLAISEPREKSWHYHFTSPIYRTPAAPPGTEYPLVLETISGQWSALPFTEFKIIENTTITLR